MSVFRYILRCLSYWSPWCIWNITGRELNHYRSMCDKREIKKEVLHHVSKSPCVSANNPPSSAYKNSRTQHPGPAVTQDMYLYKHRSLESYNPLGCRAPRHESLQIFMGEGAFPCSGGIPCDIAVYIRRTCAPALTATPISQIAEGKLFEIWDIISQGWRKY